MNTTQKSIPAIRIKIAAEQDRWAERPCRLNRAGLRSPRRTSRPCNADAGALTYRVVAPDSDDGGRGEVVARIRERLTCTEAGAARATEFPTGCPLKTIDPRVSVTLVPHRP